MIKKNPLKNYVKKKEIFREIVIHFIFVVVRLSYFVWLVDSENF